jgi:uncharacterized protein YbjT (DUF2867 family)
MKALVIGGTGTVGSQVVRELMARNAEVTVLTRSAKKQEALPPGVKGIIGDLLDPRIVRSIFRGIDGVFLANAIGVSETHQGLMAINGLQFAAVPRVVYLGVHDMQQSPHLLHHGAKIAVEAALRASTTKFTILGASNFCQNDLHFKHAMLEHRVYPNPLGSIGVSRVDVRDIAEVAAIALTTGTLDGQVVNLVGPDPLTGAGLTEIWGRVLDRPIRYIGEDLDAWEKEWIQLFPEFRTRVPPSILFDVRLTYALFIRQGLKGTPEDIDRLTRILGHPPRRFEDYARETADEWLRAT